MIAPKIQDLYDYYISIKNDENSEQRYKGKEKYYHASGAYSCRRKLYFESVLVAEKTNAPKNIDYRKMRLGTVFHSEMEDCFNYLNSQPSNKTLSKTVTNTITSIPSSILNSIPRDFKVHQEKEIIIDELNVRGFYDLVLEMNNGEIYLYDFKTMGAFPWKKKFGKLAPPSKPSKYEFQLGTYGYAVKKEFGRLDGMFLVYYNKDTSVTRQVPVNLNYVSIAYQHWREVNSHHEQGMPKLEKKLSPVEAWECNYCAYKDACDKI